MKRGMVALARERRERRRVKAAGSAPMVEASAEATRLLGAKCVQCGLALLPGAWERCGRDCCAELLCTDCYDAVDSGCSDVAACERRTEATRRRFVGEAESVESVEPVESVESVEPVEPVAAPVEPVEPVAAPIARGRKPRQCAEKHPASGERCTLGRHKRDVAHAWPAAEATEAAELAEVAELADIRCTACGAAAIWRGQRKVWRCLRCAAVLCGHCAEPSGEELCADKSACAKRAKGSAGERTRELFWSCTLGELIAAGEAAGWSRADVLGLVGDASDPYSLGDLLKGGALAGWSRHDVLGVADSIRDLPPGAGVPSGAGEDAPSGAGEDAPSGAGAGAGAGEPCECGGEFAFDPLLIGATCGGLELRGWDVCAVCAATRISRRAVAAEAWKLAKSGVSIDVGGARIRAESSAGGRGATAYLMRRISRVPDLERALAQIAAGAAGPAAIAMAALEGGTP